MMTTRHDGAVTDGTNHHSDENRTLPERVIDAVVGSVVSPIVESVDVDEVVDRIDVNHVVERLDLDELVGRVDLNAALGRIDLDRLMDRLDLDELVGRIDLNAALDRIDLDRLMDRLDLDELVGRIDLNAVLGRIDVEAVIERVDVNAVIGRVDVNAVVERVDVEAVIGRVDVNTMMDRVDVNALVERTELGDIIARSTTGVFTQVLDLVRSQIMRVDRLAQNVPARVLRGNAREAPATPKDSSDVPDPKPMSISERSAALQGHFAGSVSRFLAFIVDQFLIGVLYGMGALLGASALEIITGEKFVLQDYRWLALGSFLLWSFSYTAGSLAATGRTIGKGLLGLVVVDADGRPLKARRAALRTLCFPISFLLFGIGFLIGLVRRDRRELHDLIAKTAVIYSWNPTEPETLPDR